MVNTLLRCLQMMVLLSQSSADGDVSGRDLLDITDFAVTSNGSKYQHPRATQKTRTKSYTQAEKAGAQN